MKKSVLLSVALLSAIGLGLLAPDAVAQEKSLKDQLIGTWTFISTTGKLADGSPVWGPNPKGLQIFTDNGRYSSLITRTGVPKFAANNRMQGTPDENKAAVQGSVANFGTYTVNEASKTFTVRFEGSTYPNNEGTEQTRSFTIMGDELKVINPASTATGAQSELVYKRAK
jgi:hypothetical protein